MPDPTPHEDTVDLDLRLDDDGNPLADALPTEPSDVPAYAVLKADAGPA